MSWLGFAHPAWLGGLAALAVPLLIHLLSRGRRRRMAVGSVRWLAPAATSRARRVRPSRWWLLAVRTLLVALVVLVLAAPRLALAPRPMPPWLLVAPELVVERPRLAAANPDLYRRLDALLAAGTTLRWLGAGLPPGNAGAPPAVAAETATDVWSLVREADAAAPPAVAFQVFAADRQAGLRGARPTLGRPVTWHAAADPRVNHWLERAVVSGAGELRLTLGTSDPAATRYARVVTPAEEAEAAGWRVRRDGDAWLAEVADGDALDADDALAVAATTARVWILHAAERQVDALHVRAGIEAAAIGADLVLELEVRAIGAADAAPPARRPDVVFWLSPVPVGEAALAARVAGATLVSDALDRFEPVDWQQTMTPGAVSRFDRRGPVDAAMDRAAAPPLVLWGTPELPLLDVQADDEGGPWLRLYGRFHPSWTDLVTTGALPRWLVEVLRGATPVPPSARRQASDRRRAGESAVPRRGDDRVAADPDRPASPAPPASWLWLAVATAAAGERWLATRGAA